MQVEAPVLVQYLNSFDSAGEIVSYFASIGVKGYRQDEGSCPIAQWLSGRLGCSVSVEDKISVYCDNVYDDPAVYETSAVVKEFIDEFDRGLYPMLDAEDEDHESPWL